VCVCVRARARAGARACGRVCASAHVCLCEGETAALPPS
jgi:hypothetical protein